MSLAAKQTRRKGRAGKAPVMCALAGVSTDVPQPGDLAPPFRMPQIRRPSFPDRVVDIRDHGAVGDDRTDCTAAIEKAIATCAKAGGGRVLIPAGKWFTGPIRLRSNIDLHLHEGAIVRFSSDPARYLPSVLVRWGGMDCHNYSPLIYARDCQNIAITGRGMLLGQGKPWWGWEKLQQRSRAKQYDMVTARRTGRSAYLRHERIPAAPAIHPADQLHQYPAGRFHHRRGRAVLDDPPGLLPQRHPSPIAHQRLRRAEHRRHRHRLQPQRHRRRLRTCHRRRLHLA